MKKRIAFLLAALMLASVAACVPSKNKGEAPAPTEAVTAAPGEVTSKKPTETAEPVDPNNDDPIETPTPEPWTGGGVPCPSNDIINAHDFEAIVRFFNEKDENGVTNGEKLNKNFDASDPSTWYHLATYPTDYTDENGVYMSPVVEWSGGHLSYVRFPGLGLVGTLDLSNCERLRAVSLDVLADGLTDDYTPQPNRLKELNISGCPKMYSGDYDGHGLHLYDARIESIIPTTLSMDALHVGGKSLKKLHWIAIPTDYNFGSHDFEVILEAEGEGYVGAGDGDREHYVEASIYAYAEDGYRFVGWYDRSGKLVSSEARYELTSLETASRTTGVFDFIAKFEKAS